MDTNIIESQYNFINKLQPRKTTDTIVLHHADASNCSVVDIHKWHLERGWSGIGYHFLVRKNGEIYRGRPINTIGAHVAGFNNTSIGICAEGAYNTEYMPDTQTYSIVKLINYINDLYGDVLTLAQHRDLAHDTDCAGKNYPIDIIRVLTTPKKIQSKHWAEQAFDILISKGIKINEQRFDDNITRGEIFALLAQLVQRGEK